MKNNMNISPYTYPGMRGIEIDKKDFDISSEEVINDVCTIFDLTPDELKSPSRKSNIVEARHIVMYILSNRSRMTCVAIGCMFNRDHTSVIHAREKIKGWIDSYPKYKKFINDICSGSLTAMVVADLRTQ